MSRIIIATLLAAVTVLPGCFVWHSDTEREKPVVGKTARACGNEICASDQDCVTVAGTFRCE